MFSLNTVVSRGWYDGLLSGRIPGRLGFEWRLEAYGRGGALDSVRDSGAVTAPSAAAQLPHRVFRMIR